MSQRISDEELKKLAEKVLHEYPNDIRSRAILDLRDARAELAKLRDAIGTGIVRHQLGAHSAEQDMIDLGKLAGVDLMAAADTIGDEIAKNEAGKA